MNFLALFFSIIDSSNLGSSMYHASTPGDGRDCQRQALAIENYVDSVIVYKDYV